MPLRRPIALVLGLAMAACSGSPAPTAEPRIEPTASAGLPESTSGPTQTAGPPPSSGPPGSAPVATPTEAPVATGDTDGWRIVGAPLALPAAYVDFGFAGNGDLLVVGTDDLTARPFRAWIERWTVAGERTGRVAVDQRMTFLNGDWIDVDASTDTVLFQQMDLSTGLSTVYRVSSTTGATTKKLGLHRAILRVAVDHGGRLFGVSPSYATQKGYRPCLVDRIGSDGGIAAGVDAELEPCGERIDSSFDPSFDLPVAIDVDAAGRLVFSDEDEIGSRPISEPARLGLTTVTTGFDFVDHRDLDNDVRHLDPSYGTWLHSWMLTGDADGRICVGETLVSEDGSRSIGNRVRCFSTSGDVLAVYGHGGDAEGVRGPQAPRIGSDGSLWVIDIDDGASPRSYVIRVRAAIA
jgi:hypothetical protein